MSVSKSTRLIVVATLALVLLLGAAPTALGMLDRYGAGTYSLAFAPYTETTVDGAGRALGYWETYATFVTSFAPYTDTYKQLPGHPLR